ncbi:MAG TPA: NAD(P)/FAD-dependent oxidoreductase [Burkholderiaceae bacterium]
MKRRAFLAASGAALVAGHPRVFAVQRPLLHHVVVVGGGYGGATAAKYLSMWGEGRVRVTLIEPRWSLVSCPLSNLVLGGSRSLIDLTLSYDTLSSRYRVRIVRDSAVAIDAAAKSVRLAGGGQLGYDRLVLSPGVDMVWDTLPGMLAPGAQDTVLHAWKAGTQTAALRAQLEAMADGGTFVISVPPAPYRCPPGPYERACQVAHYFKQFKPRSKVLLLDANEDVVSKPALFKQYWAREYRGILEYVPNFRAVDVDVRGRSVISELGDKVQGAVLNVIPPQRAGAIAMQAGLANSNKRWCEVDFLTFESTQALGIHVLGDAIQTAQQMPKSAHMANQHAKVCAAAIVDLLEGRAPSAAPMLTNTCYSYVSASEAIHVASVHAYDAAKKTLLPVPGSGGVSAQASTLEASYAANWAANIWADTLG